MIPGRFIRSTPNGQRLLCINSSAVRIEVNNNTVPMPPKTWGSSSRMPKKTHYMKHNRWRGKRGWDYVEITQPACHLKVNGSLGCHGNRRMKYGAQSGWRDVTPQLEAASSPKPTAPRQPPLQPLSRGARGEGCLHLTIPWTNNKGRENLWKRKCDNVFSSFLIVLVFEKKLLLLKHLCCRKINSKILISDMIISHFTEFEIRLPLIN